MRLTLPLLAACARPSWSRRRRRPRTLSYEGDTLVYRADPGVRDSPMLGKDDQGRLNDLRGGSDARPGCTSTTTRRTARCPAASGWSSATATTGTASAPTIPANLPVEVYGGDGKDQLQTYGADHVTLDGGAGNDMLKGWDSNETLLGGPGDDEINGSGGNDHIEGGDGNDSISPDTYHDPAPDYVDGGAGIDTVDDWTIPDNDYNPPVSVSMDGVANDGRPARTTTSSTSRRSSRTSPARCPAARATTSSPSTPTSTRATRRCSATAATTS